MSQIKLGNKAYWAVSGFDPPPRKKLKLSAFRSPIAQSVERRTVNPQVPGSSPGRGANNQERVRSISWPVFR
jgi:hypothetical protein